MTSIRPLLLLATLLFTAGCLPIGEDTSTNNGSNGSATDEPNDEISDDGSAIDCDTATTHDARILCAHNQARADASNPTPSPALQPMVWNEALAQVAQDYAETCVWAHNSDRGDTFNVYIGENLYASTAEPDPETAVINWVDEVADYNYTNNSCSAGKMCGHYTQVVWRETNEVGCATHFCPQITNLSWPNGGYMVVCNYAPGGNYVGQQPY